MYCEKCGTALPEEALFCFKCGKAVRPELVSKKAFGMENNSSNYEGNSSDIGISNTACHSYPSNMTSINVICPKCGFTGKMRIVQRDNLTLGRKLLYYLLGYGALFIVGYFLEIILQPLFSWLILFIIGFIYSGIGIRYINTIINNLGFDKVSCPQCNTLLNVHKKV